MPATIILIKKNINLTFLLIIFLLSFFLIDWSKEIVSYKFIYLFQIITIFFIVAKNKNLKFTRETYILIFVLFYISINYVYNLKIDIKSIVILLSFFSLSCINFSKKIISLANFKYKVHAVIFFLIIIFFSFKNSNVGVSEDDPLAASKTLFAFQYILSGVIEPFSINRFGYFNLDPNYTALLFLMVAHFLSNNFRNKEIVFFLLSVVILFLTRSKCGLVYFLIYFFSNYIKNLFSNYKFIFFSFILVNISVVLISLIFISIVPTPFYSDPPSIEKEKAFLKWRGENYKYFQDILFCTSAKSKFYLDEKNLAILEEDKEFMGKYNQKLTLLNNYYKSSDKSRQMQSINADGGDEEYFCLGKSKRNHLVHIFNHSNYHRFFAYGVSSKEILTNVRYFIFLNPIHHIKQTNKYSPREIIQYFSPHSLFLDSLIRFGIIVGICFLLNFYFLLKRVPNPGIVAPFFFSSIFLSFDTLMFSPLLVLLMIQEVKND